MGADLGKLFRLLQKVKILLHGRWLNRAGCDATCRASFQVKGVLEPRGIFNLQRVLHQHYMDTAHALRVESENPKNLDKKTVRVLVQVVEIALLNSQECRQFRPRHRLDYESLVMAEKEKTS